MILPVSLFSRPYTDDDEERVSVPANWCRCLMLRIGNTENWSDFVPAENALPDDLQVIVPNLHRRYSGVTATNRMVAPKLAKLFRAGWCGSDAPEGIARLSGADVLKLWRRRQPLIWHARRNNEMIAG